MRISDSSMIRQFLAALQQNKTSINRSLGQLADGKQVRFASDDPSGARSSIEMRGRLVRTEGYRRSANSANYDLDTVEESLGQVFNLLVEIRSKAMAGASSIAQEANPVLANEIETLRDEILALANRSQNGRYLFGGTETLDPPFDENAVYQGNNDEVQAAVDRERSVGVTVSGERVFQDGGDIFTTLTDLADALRNNDTPALQTLIGDLTDEMDHVSLTRAEIGTRQTLIERTLENLIDEQLRLQTRIAEIENIDLEQVAVELSAADTTFQSLSISGARTLGLSLFDYLG